MSDVIIFAGPSLGVREATEIAQFEYRLPAAQGDVFRAVARGARVLGLIDGYFEGVPAVWHKEILFALAGGVHVFGAASMGALRAAELSIFGMRGIGRIYEWYDGGTVEGDDEVALVHGPAETGFMALSEPLVNIRATLETARKANVVSAELGERILVAAKGIFYKERTWESLIAAPGLAGADLGRFTQWLPHNRIDQKRLDARAMIETIATFLAQAPQPFQAKFVFEPTHAWDMGIGEFHNAVELPELDELILDEARLLPDQFRNLAERAALVVLAGRVGNHSMKQGMARLVDDFRSGRGLSSSIDFRAWQTACGLSEVELGEILVARASAAATVAELGGKVLREILNEIKLGDLHRELLERAERKVQALSRAGPQQQMLLQILLEWYFEGLGRAVPRDLDAVCREFALPDREALKELLAREFVFDRVKD